MLKNVYERDEIFNHDSEWTAVCNLSGSNIVVDGDPLIKHVLIMNFTNYFITAVKYHFEKMMFAYSIVLH